jgi:O-antigen/teichoic acid export membrane protein
MSLGRAALWSLLDQLLLSALHFAVGLAVLRLTNKSAYGGYVLCWSILLLLGGLQNAFVNAQMTVRAAGLPDDEQRSIVSAYFAAQCVLYVPIALAVLCAAAIAAVALPDSTGFVTLAATISVAFPGIALREFARSSLLLRLDARRVFFIDAMYALTLACIVATSALVLPAHWLGVIAILGLGCASLLAALPAISRLVTLRGARQLAAVELRKAARNGTWAAAGVIVTHIQSQSYVYLLGALAGLAVTAEASAARLFLMPVSIAFTSIQRTLYPHWVTLARSADRTQLSRMSRAVFLAISVLVAAYAAILVFVSEPLIATVLGAKYRASSTYIGLFAFLTWAEATRSLVSLQLQAHTRFREITIANVITATVVVATGVFAVRTFGPSASVLVQAAGDVLLAGLLLYALRRMRPIH